MRPSAALESSRADAIGLMDEDPLIGRAVDCTRWTLRPRTFSNTHTNDVPSEKRTTSLAPTSTLSSRQIAAVRRGLGLPAKIPVNADKVHEGHGETAELVEIIGEVADHAAAGMTPAQPRRERPGDSMLGQPRAVSAGLRSRSPREHERRWWSVYMALDARRTGRSTSADTSSVSAAETAKRTSLRAQPISLPRPSVSARRHRASVPSGNLTITWTHEVAQFSCDFPRRRRVGRQ